MKMIKNAHLLLEKGEEIENGIIIFDEKIVYAGCDKDVSEYNIDEVIDVNNNFVTAGLVDAHCHVGMFEDSIGFEGDDGNEDSDPVTPHLRAIDAINPFDRAFSDALKAGITTVVTGPGSANPVGGQFAAVKTYGICIDDMIVKSPCAMKMALGENPKTVYNEKNQAPATRMGTMALIRELFIKAMDYKEQMDTYFEDEENNEKPDFDIKLDAMLAVLNREIPVKVHAHRADDICSAIRLGKEFNVDVTIEHCTDGVRVLDILKRENLNVNLGPTFGDRSKVELKNMSYDIYKKLSDEGIGVAIITDHPEITIENLPFCAVMAVKHGMDKAMALDAITVNAARNNGIDNSVGSIKEGLDADFAVFTRPPFEFDAQCVMTVIDGKCVYKKQ